MSPFLLYSIFAVLNLYSVSCDMPNQEQLTKIQKQLTKLQATLKRMELELGPKYTTEPYDDYFNSVKNCNSTEPIPATCSKAVRSNAYHDGIYLLAGAGHLKPFYVYCYNEDMGNGITYSWLVIQRRITPDETFHRNRSDYKLGFGSLHGSYWLGLERIRQITAAKKHELYIRLEDHSGKVKRAQYSHFYLGKEKEPYTLHVRGYSGNAGDYLVNGNRFSTYDSDNDRCGCECAMLLSGGWWFGDLYGDCGRSNLNGAYKTYSNRYERGGITWHDKSDSYRFVLMAIRPV